MSPPVGRNIYAAASDRNRGERLAQLGLWLHNGSMNIHGGEQPSEIDKAIELLIALKSARPKAFEEAIAKINAASMRTDGDESTHASALVLGLIKGSCGRDSARMLLEICPKLPKLASGAHGVASRPGSKPSSLASKVARLHGLGGAWTRFFMQSIRDGAMPVDPECAFDLLCRIEETMDDPEEGSSWLGHPDSFHETLGAFFDWPIDWRALETEANFAPLPWIAQCWLHEGGAESFKSALGATQKLMAGGAREGLGASMWLDFARPPHPEHAEQSLSAMAQCLRLCLPMLVQQGARASHMFCRLAYPTPSMPQALKLVASIDPQGISFLDADGLSCLYWLNARVNQHESPQWQEPMLECFHALVGLGADPRLIAPQVALSSIAKHPKIAAAVEAAEISRSCAQGAPSETPSL